MTTPADSRSCPSSEDLAAYLEGKASEATRQRIATHLVECNECLAVVREAAAYERDQAAPDSAPMRLWPVAAILAIAVLTAVLIVATLRDDPLRSLAATVHEAGLRPFEGRIAAFKYTPYRALRGEADSAAFNAINAAAEGVVEETKPDDARELHAVGVALLSLGRNADAVEAIERATELSPQAAEYRADLAAARIALGTGSGDREQLRRALADCDRALRDSPRSPSTLFNRAVVLERLGDAGAARHAYQEYLAQDRGSGWADEARWRMERLPR